MPKLVVLGGTSLIALAIGGILSSASPGNPHQDAWRRELAQLSRGEPETREVRVLDLDHTNKRVTEEIVGAIRNFDETAPRTDSPTCFKLVASCAKVKPTVLPWDCEHEAIAIIRWKADGPWFTYCVRLWAGRWSKGELFDDDGTWRKVFTSEPNEDDVVQFVKNSNFGNNEHDPHDVVLGILVFVKDFDRLIQETLEGSSREEKERRHNEWIARHLQIGD